VIFTEKFQTADSLIFSELIQSSFVFLKKNDMEISIKLSGGQFLRGIISSPGEHAKAVIILVHGIGEHIGRYDHWIKKFNDRGFAFVGLDLPGHGKSDGKRGHIRNYSYTDEMLDTLIREYSKTFPGLPIFLYGHSLGGGIILDYLIRNDPNVKGAVVTSPYLRLAFEPPKIKMVLASVMENILPSLVQPNGLVVEHISHDPAVVTNYRNDPMVHDRISVSLFINATNAAAHSLTHAENLRIPLLLIHGSEDKLTSPGGSREFASKCNHATLKIWDNGYHELHNEPFKDLVFSYIADWLESKI
jgi:alpha-beta hydrolase superfamily lysophospholipase